MQELSIGKAPLAFMVAGATSLLEAGAMTEPEADRKHESHNEEKHGPGHECHPPTCAVAGPGPRHTVSYTSVYQLSIRTVMGITILIENQIFALEISLKLPKTALWRLRDPLVMNSRSPMRLRRP